MNVSELKPCPFCGQEEQGDRPESKALVILKSTSGKFHLVRCCGCLAEGPLCDDDNAAAMKWNCRDAPSSERQARPVREGPHFFEPSIGDPTHCALCGYAEHVQLKHGVVDQENSNDPR